LRATPRIEAVVATRLLQLIAAESAQTRSSTAVRRWARPCERQTLDGSSQEPTG
jgi:hypothetical protein